MTCRRPWALLVVALAICSGCGGSSDDSSPAQVSGTSASSPDSATTPPESALADTGFVSHTYGYSVDSAAWLGVEATEAWDGSGSPSFSDPVVDHLSSTDYNDAFVDATPTTLSLTQFARRQRAAGKDIRQCPAKLEATHSITISGEKAILDETHCPYPNGAFVLSAYTIHQAMGYVFFTFDANTPEADMRHWFSALLKDVAFNK